jgi:hypothetical protein
VTLSLLNKPYFKATTETNGSTLVAALGQIVGEFGGGQYQYHTGRTFTVG